LGGLRQKGHSAEKWGMMDEGHQQSGWGNVLMDCRCVCLCPAPQDPEDGEQQYKKSTKDAVSSKGR